MDVILARELQIYGSQPDTDGERLLPLPNGDRRRFGKTSSHRCIRIDRHCRQGDNERKESREALSIGSGMPCQRGGKPYSPAGV